MFQKRTFIVSAASIALLGVPVFADDTPGATAGQTEQRANATDQSAQNPQAGQQADQQIIQQITQLQKSPKDACDKLFVLNAAIGSQYEVQFSQLVAQKAQNSQVKEAAQKIAQDHQQMNQQLQETAKQVGVEIPQGLPTIKQAELQVMASLPADQLEKAYISDMQAEHAKAISKFQSVAQNSQSADVKQFAQQALPKLQEHQQLIQQSATALGISAGNEAVPAAARIQGSNTGASNDSSNSNAANPAGDQKATNGTGTGNQQK